MRSHTESIAIVLQEYFERTDDGWIHHRANKEIAKAGDKSEKASASAKARWSKKDANALPTQSDSNATHNTLHITQDTEHKTQKKATVVATPVGVSDSVWQEFKSLRKAKKAPITQRAIDKISEEANSAGWTLEKALEECIVRGWQAFKAEWVAKKTNPADNIRLTVPPSNEPDPELEKIKADDKKAVPPSLEVLAKMAELRRKA
jgi:glucan-binding YG repeat protein